MITGEFFLKYLHLRLASVINRNITQIWSQGNNVFQMIKNLNKKSKLSGAKKNFFEQRGICLIK